jgi:hypothetical protein
MARYIHRLGHNGLTLHPHFWSRSFCQQFDLFVSPPTASAEVACQGDLLQLGRLARHAPPLLTEEIIRRGDMVVLVHLQTLDCVVSGKTEAIKLFQHIFV